MVTRRGFFGLLVGGAAAGSGATVQAAPDPHDTVSAFTLHVDTSEYEQMRALAAQMRADAEMMAAMTPKEPLTLDEILGREYATCADGDAIGSIHSAIHSANARQFWIATARYTGWAGHRRTADEIPAYGALKGGTK